MDGASHELFAGTTLATYEHRAVGASDLSCQFEHRLHRGARRDDLWELFPARQSCLEAQVLQGEAALFVRTPDHDVELGDAARLREVVVGAELHRRDRRFDRSVAGDDDDLRGRVEVHGLAQDPDPVQLWHHQIDERHVKFLSFQRFDGGTAVRRNLDVEAALAELRLQNP